MDNNFLNWLQQQLTNMILRLNFMSQRSHTDRFRYFNLWLSDERIWAWRATKLARFKGSKHVGLSRCFKQNIIKDHIEVICIRHGISGKKYEPCSIERWTLQLETTQHSQNAQMPAGPREELLTEEDCVLQYCWWGCTRYIIRFITLYK